MCLGILIFGDKKEQLLKALWLLMSLDYWIVFDLPSSVQNWEKDTLRLLLMCLGIQGGGNFGSCSAWLEEKNNLSRETGE